MIDSARANQHKEFVAILDKAIDATTNTQVKAWLFSRKAAFQHAIDAHGAQKTLVAAHRMEPRHNKSLSHLRMSEMLMAAARIGLMPSA